MASSNADVVALEEAKRFIVDALESVGANYDHAQQLADVLVDADYKGHYSHGLNRLEWYINDIRKQACDPNVKPEILKESVSTAWVDGKNSLGPVVGNFCMKLAIEKARSTGVGWVAVKGSNHFGIAGWYSRLALKNGMLGMSFTNGSPLMVPTRAKKTAVGTNPISLAAPGENSDSFVLDMASTAVAMGKIEVQKRKGECIPEGWALDSQGNITTDPEVAIKAGQMLPLGGLEATSGYKGYGLSLLTDTLTGILSGSAYGPFIRHWPEGNTSAPDLGHCFAAIDPQCFAPGFESRMSNIMHYLREMEPANPELPVLVPGDPERNHMKTVDQQGGIKYLENQLKSSAQLAKELGIKPLEMK